MEVTREEKRGGKNEESFGWPAWELALASLADDAAVLEDARAGAQSILRQDPGLDEHPLLARLLDLQQQRLSGAAPLN